MRNALFALRAATVVLSLFCVGRLAAAEPATVGTAVPFDTYEGYFVSNQFEPKEATSFVVLKDQAAFDKVFGVAMVMGDKSHRLAPGAFDTRLVVAAIRRGSAMVDYKVASVTAEGKALVVRYQAKSRAMPGAEFACPLIVSVPKGDYDAVSFVENGKEVKRLPVTP